MVIIGVVAIVEDVDCGIIFISSQDLDRIEFVTYDEVVSGGIVELIPIVTSKYPVKIVAIASSVVFVRGIRDVHVISQSMVGIVVVVGSAIRSIRGII